MDNQQDLTGHDLNNFLYMCDICGQNDLNDMEMKMHMATMHRDDAVCLFCDLKGVTPDEMTLHINSVHFGDNSFMSENRNMEVEQSCDGYTLMKKNDYVFSDTKDALSFHMEGEMKISTDKLCVKATGIEESVDSGVSSNKRCNCSSKEEAAMRNVEDTKLGVVSNTSSLMNFTENTVQLINPNVHGQRLLENQNIVTPETEMESNLLCPFCDFVTDDGNAIERHFTVDHSDQFIAGKANKENFQSDYGHKNTLFCPICELIFHEYRILLLHVNGHFREDLQASKYWFRY